MENIEQLKEKLISEIRIIPKANKTGGQSVGIIDQSIEIEHQDSGFKLTVNEYRSQIKNFELAKKLFRFYLDEILKEMNDES